MRNNISATITGFDGSKFQLIARNIGPDENPFLVYIDGDRVDSRLIHRAGDEYILEMSSAVSVAETTDINIRFYNFDHYIEVSDDLRGFVNKPQRKSLPKGTHYTASAILSFYAWQSIIICAKSDND
jgi:hypothetical protein